MRRLIFTIALCCSGAMISCASRTGSTGIITASEPAAPALPPAEAEFAFVFGDWSIHDYGTDGNPIAKRKGVRSFRPVLGGRVLEERSAYEWAHHIAPRGEFEIRWYWRGASRWGYVEFQPHGLARLGAGWFEPDGSFIDTGPYSRSAGDQGIRSDSGAHKLSRAMEKSPFELYGEDDPDRPLIWWLGSPRLPGDQHSTFEPMQQLIRTEDATLAEKPEKFLSHHIKIPAWSRFDFTLGAWRVEWEGGAGDCTIDLACGGWAHREVLEHDDGATFTGSLSAYDEKRRLWRTYTFGESNSPDLFIGDRHGAQMLLRQTALFQGFALEGPDIRVRWHDITPGGFVRTWERSEDEGATWSVFREETFTRRE